MRYRLNVPFKEKDDAKSKGARWNGEFWYCTELTEDLRHWYEGEETPRVNTENAVSSNINGPFSNYKTVSEVNKMIMDSFDATECFKTIMVKGEVTNYKGKPDDKGNRYFSIKDDKCLLSCILWKSMADQILKSEIKVGQKVALTGRFKYYDEKGTGSLHVNQIADMGTGEANLRYMELKAKLEEEGLFAIEHKKAIPKFPEKVGIVTSKEGQARKDIEKEALKRNPYIQLILYHANVQGKNAVKTIKEGIEKLDTMGLDTIIVGRGGGSDEELIAYNDESVARAVFNAQTPIITAVGHEGNWALVDWVSDKRVATPLEAAEEAIPDVMTVIKQIRQLEKNISDNMHRALENRKHRLETQTAKLKGNDPVRKLKERKDKLENLSEGLTQKIHMIFEKKKNRYNVLLAQLNGLSPTAKLVKGFGYISVDDKPVTSISNVHINDELDIRIHDGHIVTTVIGTVSE